MKGVWGYWWNGTDKRKPNCRLMWKYFCPNLSDIRKITILFMAPSLHLLALLIRIVLILSKEY